jgi:hypothetical protein
MAAAFWFLGGVFVGAAATVLLGVIWSAVVLSKVDRPN